MLTQRGEVLPHSMVMEGAGGDAEGEEELEVPLFTLNRAHNPDRIVVCIDIPGTPGAGAVQVSHDGSRLRMRVPGQYLLEIPIPGKVAPGFEVLRFVKKTQQLRVEMALLGPQQGARPTPAASADANGSGHAAGTPAGKAHAHQSEPPRAYQDPAANHVAANGHAAQFSWAAHDDAAAHLRRQTNSRHKSEGTGEPRQQPSYTASAGEHYNGAQRESYGNGTPPQAGARHAGHRESHLDQEQEEQLYESARAQANREAAAQWAARAEEATAAGDLARAVRLLSKAAELHPGAFDLRLRQAVVHMERQQQHQQTPQQDTGSSPPPQHQSHPSHASPAGAYPAAGGPHAAGRSGAGPRPQTSPGASGAGEHARYDPYSGAQQGRSQQQQQSQQQRQQEQEEDEAELRTRHAAYRAWQDQQRAQRAQPGQSQQQKQGPQQQPQKQSPQWDDAPRQQQQQRQQQQEQRQQQQGPDTGLAGWVLSNVGSFFDTLSWSVEDFGWPALLPLLVIQGLVTLVVYLVLVVLGAFTMALPSFLMLLNLKGQAEAVDSWGRSNSLGALLVAVPGGPALPFAAAALMGWAGTHGTVLQLLSMLVWRPYPPVSIIATGVLVGLGSVLDMSVVEVLAPIPVMMWGAGVDWWCVGSVPLYFGLKKLSGSPILSSVTSAAILRAACMLPWFKALPCILTLLVLWVLAAIHLEDAAVDKDGRGTKTGKGKTSSSSGADGTAGGSDHTSTPPRGTSGQAKAGPGQGGTAGPRSPPPRRPSPPPPATSSYPSVLLKNEAPRGATGEVLRVLSARDWYTVLSLPRFTSDEDTLRKARRAASLATHPDKLGPKTVGAKEAFLRVTKAFEVLGDPAARARYDRDLRSALLRDPQSAASPSHPPAAAPKQARASTAAGTGAAGGAHSNTSGTRAGSTQAAGGAGARSQAGPGGARTSASGASQQRQSQQHSQQHSQQQSTRGGPTQGSRPGAAPFRTGAGAGQASSNRTSAERMYASDFLLWAARASASGQDPQLPCPSCGGTHSAQLTDISPSIARYCRKCDLHHAARTGDVWFEGRAFGFIPLNLNKKAYLCVGGCVLDITAYARCSGLFTDIDGTAVEANSCHVPYRFAGAEDGEEFNTGNRRRTTPQQQQQQYTYY